MNLNQIASIISSTADILKAENYAADRADRKVIRERGDFDSDVQGIPCQVVIDSCVVVKGSHSYNAPSDLDYHGYSEVEFHLLDRKGYPAAWLERKLRVEDTDRIEGEVLSHNEARCNQGA